MHTAVRKICLLLVPLSVLALGGCASQSEVDSLRSELIATQKAAENAKAEARAAKAEAAAANARAEAASKAAQDSSRKADRVFQRSLRK